MDHVQAAGVWSGSTETTHSMNLTENMGLRNYFVSVSWAVFLPYRVHWLFCSWIRSKFECEMSLTSLYNWISDALLMALWSCGTVERWQPQGWEALKFILRPHSLSRVPFLLPVALSVSKWPVQGSNSFLPSLLHLGQDGSQKLALSV